MKLKAGAMQQSLRFCPLKRHVSHLNTSTLPLAQPSNTLTRPSDYRLTNKLHCGRRHCRSNSFIQSRQLTISATAKMASTIQFYDPSAKTSLEPSEPSTTLENILATWSDRKLEARHDYIQHLFPLPERSPVNPDAPVITKDVRQAFLQKEELRVGMLKALQRMGRFYGFEMKVRAKPQYFRLPGGVKQGAMEHFAMLSLTQA